MKPSNGHNLSCTRRSPWRGFLMAIAVFAMAVGQTTDAWANCTIRPNNLERTPDSGLNGLVDNGNGTVTHTTTGLMWKKCPEGRTYSAGTGTCTGTTGSYTWQAALRRAVTDTTTGGYSDWRLPSRTELLSIVETGCASPAINTTRFPNVAASAAYWSSTHAGDTAPDSAYAVRFNHGISFVATKDFIASARLVRAGNTAHDSFRAPLPAGGPATFSFTPQTVSASTNPITPDYAISNSVTMSGATGNLNISITDGEYRINGGAWTSANGTIANTNTLELRLSIPYTVPSTRSATVNVNGRTATFLISTGTPVPDTLPDQFTFTDQTGVTPGSTVISAPITVNGINQSTEISITNGEYDINGAENWTNVNGVVFIGNTVRVRHTASASSNTTVNTTLNIGTSGTISDIFSSTTFTIDTTPNAITFATQTGVARNTEIISATHTISGINMPATVTALTAGHAYDKNDGNWITTTGGSVSNGDIIRVKHTSAAGFSGNTVTSITIGGVTGTFTSTTEAIDTTPNAFSFVDQTNVALNTDIISDPITIAGINSPATVSALTAGAYDVNGSGAWITAINGTVSNGNTIRLKRNSGASFNTPTDTTITIGGTSDTFTITTLAADTTPDAFAFTDVTGVLRSSTQTSNSITVAGINTGASISITGGTYSINGGAYTSTAGTVTNGQSVTVQHTASASYSTVTNTTLTIGGVSDTYSSTTLAAPGDSIPNAFSFTDQTAVALSSLRTSNTITVTGIDVASSISITGGEYQINSGAWTSSPSTVTVNQTVTVRHTSSASFSTATDTVLTIGGVSDTFTSTTLAADTTPDTCTLTDQGLVQLSTVIESAALTINGINTSASISVTGGEYKIGAGGTYTTNSGTVTNGQQVYVRHTSSATELTPTNTTLTVGTCSDIFTSTTGDKTPTAFSFTDQGPVALSTLITSNTLPLAGITIPANISVSGGEYQINGGAWTTTAGTISNGQTFAVRHTSSVTELTATNTTLTIGDSVSDTFTTTTLQLVDTTPDAFTFTDQTGVPPGTTRTSNSITVSGINGAASISITGGTYSINGGAYTSANGTVSNGNTVIVRHTASLDCPSTVNTILTIGGVSDTFSSTTVTTAAPNPVLTFATVNGAARDATITSELKTVSGICNGSTITRGGHLTTATYSVNGGAFGTTGTINPGQTLQLRLTMCGGSGCTRATTVTIGGATTTWTVNEN